MSESARAPMKPRDIRRRAYVLMKQCWLTLLIAAVLMHLFQWTKDAVDAHGERLATEAYKNAMAAHLAEHHAGDEFDTSWVAIYRAEEAYDEAFAPWEWLGYGIDLLDLLFSGIIAVGLCHGLLNTLRAGESTPHCLLLGWERTSTACWMAVQTTLRVIGWSLLPLIISATISALFGGWATIVSTVLMLLVALWATLHYALAPMHLADDPDNSRTASDCLRLAVDDADAFGIWQMCRVLWPLAVIFAVNIALAVAAVYAPVLTIPAGIIDIAAGLFSTAMMEACLVCIYDEMRQQAIAAQEAIPATEGLARARALANSESIS